MEEPQSARFDRDNSTAAYTRAIEDHCSRPFANREFFKNVIEIPRGWTNVIYDSCSEQYIDTNSVECRGKKENTHVTSQARILSRARQYLIGKVGPMHKTCV